MYDAPYLTLGPLTSAIDIGRSPEAHGTRPDADAHQTKKTSEVWNLYPYKPRTELANQISALVLSVLSVLSHKAHLCSLI
jgi:hypothetical protein